MTRTPIIVVEDRAPLAFAISDLFRKHQAELKNWHLEGAVQIVASGWRLLKWLDTQPKQSVRLLVVDYSIVGHDGANIVERLRREDAPLSYPTLHSQCVIIGWSAEASAERSFRDAGANGFISKQRPVTQLVADLMKVLQRLNTGESWVSLHAS